jgi:hypothetical protein
LSNAEWQKVYRLPIVPGRHRAANNLRYEQTQLPVDAVARGGSMRQMLLPWSRRRPVKIAYFGCPLAGKTTNLQYLFATARPNSHAVFTERPGDPHILTLNMHIDPPPAPPVPLQLVAIGGVSLDYPTAAATIVRDVAGVVFVADSNRDKLQQNMAYLKLLSDLIQAQNRQFRTFPIVLQYNKRDLAGNLPIPILNKYLRPAPWTWPVIESEAHRGIGVWETLIRLCREIGLQVDI